MVVRTGKSLIIFVALEYNFTMSKFNMNSENENCDGSGALYLNQLRIIALK